MRAATALIIALLLFCGLPSCSTSKKATTKRTGKKKADAEEKLAAIRAAL